MLLACLQTQGPGGATQAVPLHCTPAHWQAVGPPSPSSLCRPQHLQPEMVWKLHIVPGAAAHAILGKAPSEAISGQ